MCVLVCLSSQHCNVVIPNLIFDLWVSGGYLLIYLRDIKINIMEQEGNIQGDLGNQQVMGPRADQLTSKQLVPKFRYDGGSPAEFLADFPVVEKAFGVAAVYRWELREGDQLTEDQEEKNTLALLVLRQYLTERVLKVITVGKPKLASAVY